MISVQSLLPSATTIVDSTTLPTALPPVAAPNDDEEDTCPVCYESFPPASATTTTVSFKVCKHAVCGSYEEMLKQAGHMRCPMCRASARPAMPLHVAIHAYHCTDLACERPHTASTPSYCYCGLRGTCECVPPWSAAVPRSARCASSGEHCKTRRRPVMYPLRRRLPASARNHCCLRSGRGFASYRQFR